MAKAIVLVLICAVVPEPRPEMIAIAWGLMEVWEELRCG